MKERSSFRRVLEVPHTVDPREELDVLVHGEVAVEAEALGEIADMLLDPCKSRERSWPKYPHAPCAAV